jgi:circadian clock protein KaiC
MAVTVSAPLSDDVGRISTGVSGLDDILGGGLRSRRLYLIEGAPGTGKTTLALQFLLAGAQRGETGVYVTLSETAAELRTVAASHGWSLDAIELCELVTDKRFEPESEQSILHPSEVELGETVQSIIARVRELKPRRVVFDNLSELRLLAQSPLRFRRQILALKHFFSGRECTVLLLDDLTSDPGDFQLRSIAHGRDLARAAHARLRSRKTTAPGRQDARRQVSRRLSRRRAANRRLEGLSAPRRHRAHLRAHAPVGHDGRQRAR